MPRNQDAVMLFMGNVDCSCFPTALGLLDLLEEMDKGCTLHTSPDVYFWAKLQWRHKGVSRESLTAAYLDFKQNDIRGKAREKKRRQRMSPKMSPEKGDKIGDRMGDNAGDKTREMSPKMSPEKGDNVPSPSSPAPFPLVPPSPPTPPVTPYNPPNPIPNTPTGRGCARAEAAATAADRPDFNTIEAYASANLDYLSPYNMQDLVAFASELNDDLVRHAIDEACANGKRSWSYVRSILLRYKRAGYKTVGEVRADEDQRRQQQKKPGGYVNPALDYAQRSNSETSYSKNIIDLSSYNEEGSS